MYRVKIAIGDPDLGSVAWLVVHSVAIDTAVRALRMLGAGEAAVITLAQASNAGLVILDDRRARNTARQLGLTVVGTLGVLLAAKQVGALTALRPVLDALIAQGRHISPELHAEVLRAAGEAHTADSEEADGSNAWRLKQNGMSAGSWISNGIVGESIAHRSWVGWS